VLKALFGMFTAFSLLITGQSAPKDQTTATPVSVESHPDWHTVNAPYPPAVQEALKQLRKSGGHTIVHADNKTYLVVGAGERPTGGYHLTYDGVKKSASHTFEVRIREHKPKPGALTTQVISFPTLVVELSQPDAAVQLQMMK